ncbi:MAG: serine/threonine-protein kinase [Polyangiaceae bacterium]
MSEPAVGRIVAGKYRLERMIARGGMGSVWSAHHLQLDMPVAVKFMDPGLAAAPDARARFEREAKAAAQLRTPHVVQIHDHGLDKTQPYIVMELLQGEDLGARLRRTPRLGLPETVTIFAQAAKALRLAHEAGIIHRDLKPGNIFLARSDDDEVVKLLDFGVAKAVTNLLEETTRTGELLGSPGYMSPEQARGYKQIDARSDLWSMGVILFRMLTGVKPFTGQSLGDVIVKICVEPIPTPRQYAPDLPPSIDRFFLKALARDPARRFQSAREMAAELSVAAGVAPDVPSSLPSLPATAYESNRPSYSPTLSNATLAVGPGRALNRSILLGALAAIVFSSVLGVGLLMVRGDEAARLGEPAVASLAPEVAERTRHAMSTIPAGAPETPPGASASSSGAAPAPAARPESPATTAAGGRPRPRPGATPAAPPAKTKPDFGY